jgi:L-threonylcarbamoyladenylate synthase
VIPDPIGDAVRWVQEGGLLAYPTETVWGLGADASAAGSLSRLARWKGRGPDEPVSILVDEPGALASLGFEVSRAVQGICEAFWPGPLTLVLKSGGNFAPGVARADGAVGVRCTSHPLAAAIARRLRSEGVGPMTATSLNPSGEPAARTREQAVECCGDGEDQPRMIDVEQAEAGGDEASTVLDMTGSRPEVLRWGAVAADALEPLLRELSHS